MNLWAARWLGRPILLVALNFSRFGGASRFQAASLSGDEKTNILLALSLVAVYFFHSVTYWKKLLADKSIS